MNILRNTKFLFLSVVCLLLSISVAYSHGGEKHDKKPVKKDTVVSKAHGEHADKTEGTHKTITTDPKPLAEFPNLHPLVVHFPIVLLIVAMLMQVSGLFFKSRPFDIAVAVITGLGFLTAYLASNNFHGHAAELTGGAGALFEEHEYYAFWAVRLGGIAAIGKIITLFIRRRLMIEGLIAAVLIASAVSVSISGHHGAELVHKYGIGPKGEYLEQHH